MKLYFLLARRNPPLPSQLVIEVCDILSRRGIEIETGIAEELLLRPDQPLADCDLYLLKSYTELSLSLAGVLHAQGANLLNSYPGCYAARNKIVAAQLLAAAGIPAPASWVTNDLELLRSVVRQRPLILKPYMGWRGEGIRVIRREEDLATIPARAEPTLIQEYLSGNGEDLRLYIAGDQVFAVRKPFSPTSFAQPGSPVPVSAELRDIGLRVGEVFGLSLYGVDLIETADGPKVIDVNYFPGFKGVPGAARVVAGHIERCAYASGGLPIPGCLTVSKDRELTP